MGVISVDNIMVKGFISELCRVVVQKVSEGTLSIEILDPEAPILFEIDSNKKMTLHFLKDEEDNPFIYDSEIFSVFNAFSFEAYKSLLGAVEVKLEFTFANRVEFENNKYELKKIPFINIIDDKAIEASKFVFIYAMMSILESLHSTKFNHETNASKISLHPKSVFNTSVMVARLEFKDAVND